MMNPPVNTRSETSKNSDVTPPKCPRRQRSQAKLRQVDFDATDFEVSSGQDHSSMSRSHSTYQAADSPVISKRNGSRRTSKTSDTSTKIPLANHDELVLVQASSEEISKCRKSRRKGLTEAKVCNFLREYAQDYGSFVDQSYERWSLFFEEYCSKDFILVRPSGNPLDRKGCVEILSSDFKLIEFTLVSIDSVYILANRMAATVVYTTDQRFVYKGTPNEDRTVFTSVIEQKDNEIKIVHEHRSSGKPIPKETRWSST